MVSGGRHHHHHHNNNNNNNGGGCGGGGEASRRDVHSDSSTRERFLGVEKMAKRTAMLAEEDR